MLLLITALIIAVYAVAFSLALINGANCSGNVIGVVMGSRGVNVRTTTLLSSLLVFLGAILVGEYISRVFVKGILDYATISDPRLVAKTVLSALSSTLIWAMVALLYRVPISVSQLAVGGILGSGLILCGIACINWVKAISIIISWFLTPLISLAISLVLYKIHIYMYMRNKSAAITRTSLHLFVVSLTIQYLLYAKFFNELMALVYSMLLSLAVLTLYVLYAYLKIEKSAYDNHVYEKALIAASSVIAFSYGAHDVGNVAGPLSVVLSVAKSEASNVCCALPVALTISATGLSLGALLWGYRVAETIGAQITPLTTESSLVVQLSSSLTVFVLLVLGLPSSVTLAIVGAVAGVGYAKGLEYVNVKLLFKIALMWVSGVPVTAVLSALFSTLLRISL